MAHLHLIVQGLLEEQRLFDVKEAEKLGISHQLLQYYCVTGKLKRISSGIFAPAGWKKTAEAQIEILQRKCPDFVLCLDSAMYFHGISSEAPETVCVAIRQGARSPAEELNAKCVRIIPRLYVYGLETHMVNGQPLNVYSPARTAIDFFRYRHKVGEDCAIKKLMAIFRSRLATLDDLLAAARVCHVSKTIAPYLAMLRQT